MSTRARPGLVKQLWQNFKHTVRVIREKEHFVGRDEYGNKYFERPAGKRLFQLF